MSQTQQEAYQVMFKSTPQKFYQVVRMLSMMKQMTKAKEQRKLDQSTREHDWKKFENLREQLGLPTTQGLKEKYMTLPREQRIDLIRDCEKKILVQAGEKDYEFMIANNKMLAEPQILAKDINLDQLKNMLSEYGMQFHIKELPDLTRELHFFAKDSNIAARAISRTLENIINDPESITKPTLESLIQKAKQQSKEKQETLEKKQESTVKQGVSEKTAESAKETFESLSLFEELKEGIDL